MDHLLSGFMVGLIVTASKRAYATHCMCKVCCNQRAYPSGRSLLIHASTGDTKTLKGRCGSVGSLGSGACKVFWALRASLAGMQFDSKHDFAPPTILLGLLLCTWTQSIFFGGIQHCPVDGCSIVSCNFRVLTGEDDCMSFHSAILCLYI